MACFVLGPFRLIPEANNQAGAIECLIEVVLGHVGREIDGDEPPDVEGQAAFAAPSEAAFLAVDVGRGVVAEHEAGV